MRWLLFIAPALAAIVWAWRAYASRDKSDYMPNWAGGERKRAMIRAEADQDHTLFGGR